MKAANEDILLQGVIHEIKNPVALINATVDLMLLDAKEEQKYRLIKIKNELEYMHDIVTSSLKVVSNSIKQPVYLSDILDDLVFEYSNIYTDIAFSFSSEYSTMFYCKYELFIMMFKNILKNSVEAIQAKKEAILDDAYVGKIITNIYETDCNIFICISDNGIGYGNDTSKEGNKIGLKFIKEITTMHNGIFGIRPNQDGTTITIILEK